MAVLSGQMPRPLDRVARHAWIVVAPKEGGLKRYEYGGSGDRDDPFDDFAAGDVMLHGVVRGTAAEIAQKDLCLAEAQRAYYKTYPTYIPIPGPNSNTFVAFLGRRCALGVELPATAIGRDYVGIAGADVTEGQTGILMGTFPLGVRVGLREGLSVSFFGLPLGVHLFPPGIDLPVNPGRLGFATDTHAERPFRKDYEVFPSGPAKSGAASAKMYVAGFMTAHRERARGLEGQGIVGLSIRALYGKWVGYAAGFDLEMGFAVPSGLAYAARIFPVGFGVLVSQTGYLAFLSGVGASGVTDLAPSGVELPQELRLELDMGQLARLYVFGRGVMSFNEPLRRQGHMGFHETTLGIGVRLGLTTGGPLGAVGSGTFLGVERREIMGTSLVGLVLGTELDAGLTKR